jgi:hypothetical protein
MGLDLVAMDDLSLNKPSADDCRLQPEFQSRQQVTDLHVSATTNIKFDLRRRMVECGPDWPEVNP